MRIKDVDKWNNYVSVNKTSYGKSCVCVARRVMELLDENPNILTNDYTAHDLICKACADTQTGEITEYMEGWVAKIVVDCHERGEEFRKIHNGDEDYDYKFPISDVRDCTLINLIRKRLGMK